MARQRHDTLSQGLVGIILQVEAATYKLGNTVEPNDFYFDLYLSQCPAGFSPNIAKKRPPLLDQGATLLMDTSRVQLVYDHQIEREDLRIMIELSDDIECKGEACIGQEAITTALF